MIAVSAIQQPQLVRLPQGSINQGSATSNPFTAVGKMKNVSRAISPYLIQRLGSTVIFYFSSKGSAELMFL